MTYKVILDKADVALLRNSHRNVPPNLKHAHFRVTLGPNLEYIVNDEDGFLCIATTSYQFAELLRLEDAIPGGVRRFLCGDDSLIYSHKDLESELAGLQNPLTKGNPAISGLDLSDFNLDDLDI